MSKRFSYRIAIAAAIGLSAFTTAQSADPTWEGGVEIVYQDAGRIDFNGGSKIDLDDDLGLTIIFGYRLNSHLDIQFALDWASTDYRATLIRNAGAPAIANGELEYITPRLNVQFNLFNKAFTPYVMAGVGYAFIDTNIPNGRPSTGCWWDPWYGYICTTVQSTFTTDEFVYQGGVGARWDFSSTGSIRLGYERHWIDLGRATGEPFVDQVRLGFTYRYD
jgi:opacity protein-like surface antigen